MIEFFTWLIGGFFSFLGFVYVYYKYTNSNFKLSWKYIILFIVCVILLALIYYFDFSFLSIISYFIFCPVLYYNIECTNVKRLIFYMLIIWIYAFVIDLILMSIISLLNHFYTFDVYGYLYEVMMSIILCIMLFLLANSRKISKVTLTFYDKLLNIKYFDYSLIVFTVFALLIGMVIFMNLKHLRTNMLLTIISILIVFMFIILIKYRVYLIENAILIKNIKDNSEFFIKIEDDSRIFRHNLNAKLLSIKSVSNKKAKLLLEELLKENNQNIANSKMLVYIPYGLYGIIYEKIYPYINVLNIQVNNNFNEDIFDFLKPRRYNVLAEKTVIMLDNAIEASLNSDDKVLHIDLYTNENDIVVEIKNTFSNVVDLCEIGKIGYSTKGNNRGLGIFSSIRNNEVSVSIKILNNIFNSEIIAKKNFRK